jgi:hypothetical protein
MRHRHMTIIPDEPVNRGRLMTAQQVATELFDGTVSPQWVRRNCPKVTLGHSTVRHFEADVREWIESRREGAA